MSYFALPPEPIPCYGVRLLERADMPHFHPEDERHNALMESIGQAARHIATAITEGFKHMADSQTKALADLQAALTNIADAIAAEIGALQTALTNSGQPDDSGQIEAAVTNLNSLTDALKKSIPAATGAGPVLSSLTPTSGPASGGTSVTLTGTGFTGATAVTVGGAAAASFSVTNDTTIALVTPAGTGTAPVVVTTPAGSSDGKTAFSYV